MALEWTAVRWPSIGFMAVDRWNGADSVDNADREQMRAADADRQVVVERLRSALDEGRLDLHEYDERIQQAYSARTYGDLDGLLNDLPSGAVVPSPADTAVPARPGEPAGPVEQTGNPTAQWLRTIWGSWLGVVGVTTAIWAITSLASQDAQYFWPMWVGGPWAVFLVIATISGLAGGAPQKMVAGQQQQRLAKEHRRQRRELQARAIQAGELPPKPTKQQRRQFVAKAIERGDLPPKPRKQ